MGLDRISDLPWDVLDTIMVRLPLKEAVRTSVLSAKWRHRWARLSRFVVDDKLFPTTLDRDLRWGAIEEILDRVRLSDGSHRGPIERFELGAYCRPDHAALLRWAAYLFGKGLKEFVLRYFVSPRRFGFPIHSFPCRQLTRLELFGCSLDLPEDSPLESLGSLSSLTLASVHVPARTLEGLVLKSPNLERLVLLDLDLSVPLRLRGAKLRYLKIASEFEDVCLVNSPSLETVDLRLLVLPASSRELEGSALVRVIGCLKCVVRLALTSEILAFLAERNVPERLPCLLENLKVLELREISADNLKHFKVSFCLLKSAPNLEELHISVGESFGFWRPVVDFLRAQALAGLYFNRLKVLRFIGSWDVTLARHFIEHVLATSPMLENVTLIRFNGARVPEEAFSQFERASRRVKIVSLSSAF